MDFPQYFYSNGCYRYEHPHPKRTGIVSAVQTCQRLRRPPLRAGPPGAPHDPRRLSKPVGLAFTTGPPPDGGHDHRRRDRAHRDLGGGRQVRRRAPRDVRAARRDGRAARGRVRHVSVRVATTAQRLTYLAATHTHTRQLDAAALAAYLSELHDAGRAASSAALRWADVAVGDRASQRVFSEAVQTADMRVDCEHHSPAYRCRSVTLVGAGG